MQFEARSTKKTATLSNEIKRSCSPRHAACRVIEKALCMKTKDQLCQKESVILRPRVVLEADSQSGSQDLRTQEARQSAILSITITRTRSLQHTTLRFVLRKRCA